MIIVAYKSGDHSNRLFQNLHFEAFCKENGLEYINPTFFNMRKYYTDPCRLHKGFKGIPLMSLFVKRVLRKLKLLNVIFFDVEDQDNKDALLAPPGSRADILVAGWYFRVSGLVEKYQDYFIKKYSLKKKYYTNNEFCKKIDELRGNGLIIVGVHIRRGDYKNWQGGKFYFADEVYKKYMKNIENEILKHCNKKCAFFIFSNDQSLIEENNYIYKSKNKWYIDHLLMTKCDFLIGPPSTFTLWASYIGKVKYYQIENDSGKIDINDFSSFKG